MISITNSKGNITICKVESIEIDIKNHQFIINGYVMEQEDLSTDINNKQRGLWESNAYCLRNSILNILHDKEKGRYCIEKDLTMRKAASDKK